MSDGQDFSTFEAEANGAAPADPPATPPEPEAEEGGDEGAPDEGSEPADGDAPPAGPSEEEKIAAKRLKTQERWDKLTRERHEAERDAKYWRDVAEGRARPNGGQPPAVEAPKAPNPDDYDLGRSDERYIEDTINFRVDQGLKKGLDAVKSDVAQDLHIQAAGRAWEAKQDSARSEYADYDEVVRTHDPVTGAPRWPCSEVAAEAIQTSDAGAKIAYHLASHPDEARRISALSPLAQVLEIGKIEATLTSSARPADAKTTNAPKPPANQARGAGGHFTPNAATTNFEEFEAMARKAG